MKLKNYLAITVFMFVALCATLFLYTQSAKAWSLSGFCPGSYTPNLSQYTVFGVGFTASSVSVVAGGTANATVDATTYVCSNAPYNLASDIYVNWSNGSRVSPTSGTFYSGVSLGRGQAIQKITSVTISAVGLSPGTYVDAACFDYDGGASYGYTETVSGTTCIDINVLSPPPPPNPSVTLTVNGSESPKPIEEGGIINVKWVPGNAASCSASGDWTGNKSVSGGTENNSDDALVLGIKTYKIKCDGASGTTPASATVSILVARKPYLRVYGGDVVSGSGFDPSCSKNSSAQITAYSKGGGNNNNGVGWSGAGAQYAVQAHGAIDQFVSAMLRGSNPAPPKGLTFANTSGTYGASFGDAPCVKDYFGTITSGTTDPGSTYVGGSISNGSHTILKHDGDVAITGNVIYTSSGSWANLSQLPSLYLVVRGNIYIDRGVTQLDGAYIAQPKADGGGGIIYTCSNGGSPYADSALYANCANKLTVNGAFIAKQVKFGRINGTLRQSTVSETSTSANIAEVFNFSPELWLTSPGLVTGGTVQLDSITSLPPIL